jgi:hypothetical protein
MDTTLVDAEARRKAAAYGHASARAAGLSGGRLIVEAAAIARDSLGEAPYDWDRLRSLDESEYETCLELAQRFRRHPVESFTIQRETGEITSVLMHRVRVANAAPRPVATPRARERRSSSSQRARAPDDPSRPRRRCENSECRLPLDGRPNKHYCNDNCRSLARHYRNGATPRAKKPSFTGLVVSQPARLPRRFEVDLLRSRSRPMNGHHEWPGSHLMVEVVLA